MSLQIEITQLASKVGELEDVAAKLKLRIAELEQLLAKETELSREWQRRALAGVSK